MSLQKSAEKVKDQIDDIPVRKAWAKVEKQIRVQHWSDLDLIWSLTDCILEKVHEDMK